MAESVTQRPAAECTEPDVFDDTPLDHEDIALIAKALAHPARLEIVRKLSLAPVTRVQQIVDGSTLAQSTVSEHLRILREAGVIAAHREGTRAWYCLCRSRLRRYLTAIEPFAAATGDDRR